METYWSHLYSSPPFFFYFRSWFPCGVKESLCFSSLQLSLPVRVLLLLDNHNGMFWRLFSPHWHTQFTHTPQPAEPEKEEESKVLFAFGIWFSIALETCWDLLLNYYYISNVHSGFDSFVKKNQENISKWVRPHFQRALIQPHGRGQRTPVPAGERS